jgi:hypothetical protein
MIVASTKEPYFIMMPASQRLCPNYVLHGVPQRLMQTRFDIHSLPVTLQHPDNVGNHCMQVAGY